MDEVTSTAQFCVEMIGMLEAEEEIGIEIAYLDRAAQLHCRHSHELTFET